MHSAFKSYSDCRAREADTERRRSLGLNPVRRLTEGLIDALTACNPEFKMVEKIPRRVLTHPYEPHPGSPDDNIEHNLICRVHDALHGDAGGETYIVVDLLGTGTFGQVLRCRRVGANDSVAVKIIKNKPAYRVQSLLETKVLKLLNNKCDTDSHAHIVKLLETFDFKGHVCLVFELLDYSLYDLLTQNQYRGLPLFVIQSFTKQILSALLVMQEANVIHCDLKPENIMISMVEQHSTAAASQPSYMDSLYDRPVSSMMMSTPSPTAHAPGLPSTTQALGNYEQSAKRAAPVPSGHHLSQSLKVIDFGSVCFESKTLFHYIQSRFYRSPEVLVGFPYNGAIDMWSLGCVCCEMFLGLPIFPGVSQHNQLSRIIEMLGMPSDILLENGNLAGKYFKKTANKGISNESVVGSIATGYTVAPKQDHGAENIGTPICRTNSASQERLHALSSIRSEPSGKYRLKTAAEYAKDTSTKVPVLKKYLKHDKLDDVILKYPYPHIPPGAYKDRAGNPVSVEYIMGREQKKRECFLHFLHGILALNPWERWTAKQAFNHPFISNEFSMDRQFWAPSPDPKMNERVFAVIAQVQSKEAKKQHEKHSPPPPPVPLQAHNNQTNNIGATSESPRNSSNCHQSSSPHDNVASKTINPSRSSSRQSFESAVNLSRGSNPSSDPTGIDIPKGAVHIKTNSGTPLPPGAPPHCTPCIEIHQNSVGDAERGISHNNGPEICTATRPPLPPGPPPRFSAAAVASASYPPPIFLTGLMGAWTLPPPMPAGPPYPLYPSHHHFSTPPAKGHGVHMNPGDYSPRHQSGTYFQHGDFFTDSLVPGIERPVSERKQRALTQINMHDLNLDRFNRPQPPPFASIHGSGGFRRESFDGSSSLKSGVLSDFDLAILRTPTDQSRVFQSMHTVAAIPDIRRQQHGCLDMRPPPPPMPPPPQIPRGTQAEMVHYYPSSSYGVAQSYDSYRPMVMQNAMQNYNASGVAARQYQPPLPPGPPPLHVYDMQMMPVLSNQLSAIALDPQSRTFKGYAHSHVPLSHGASSLPPPQQSVVQHLKRSALDASHHSYDRLVPVSNDTDLYDSSVLVNADLSAELAASDEREAGSDDLNNSPTKAKGCDDDADPFFTLDDA